jgi:CMP-N-acetylneuraminic acid synthetase
VPGKALRELGGVPLIAHTIRAAQRIEGIDHVFVTTDSAEIQSVAIEYGAEAPFLRPPSLAQDDSLLHDVFLHLYSWCRDEIDFVPELHMILSPTYPLRRSNTLHAALKHMLRHPRIYNLRSVLSHEGVAENLWLEEGGELVAWCGEHKGAVYEDLSAFNIVADCRAGSGDLAPHPYPITFEEAVDIDEPIDLEIAKLVYESQGWACDRL